MTRFTANGTQRLAKALTALQIRALRNRGVLERNRRLVRYCDLAANGSERARLALARFMLLGELASRPGKVGRKS